MAGSALDLAYAQCESQLRDRDRDRWLASLFAPDHARRHVQALAAFSLEVARVREVVHEPMPGEIRLQWWADALAGVAHGEVSGHPVAAALFDTIERFGLPRPPLVALVEARRFDLYDDAPPTLTDVEGYAGETVSALLQAQAMVLCGGADPRAADASGHAGVAQAITGLLRAMPIWARRGQCFWPEDVLRRHGANADMIRSRMVEPPVLGALAEMAEHARHHLDRATTALEAVDPRARPAYVGLALVEPQLRAVEAARDPFADVTDIAGWRKPLALWMWSRRR